MELHLHNFTQNIIWELFSYYNLWKLKPRKLSRISTWTWKCTQLFRVLPHSLNVKTNYSLKSRTLLFKKNPCSLLLWERNISKNALWLLYGYKFKSVGKNVKVKLEVLIILEFFLRFSLHNSWIPKCLSILKGWKGAGRGDFLYAVLFCMYLQSRINLHFTLSFHFWCFLSNGILH